MRDGILRRSVRMFCDNVLRHDDWGQESYYRSKTIMKFNETYGQSKEENII